MDTAAHSTATLREYLVVLRRRRWIVIQMLVLVPAVAVALALREPTRYQATAEVLLNQQSLAAGVSGLTPVGGPPSPETQAEVARVPAVAWRVLQALSMRDRSVGALLGQSSVAVKPGSDVLLFAVTDPVPAVATTLATEYAKQFTSYRRYLDTASIVDARRGVQVRIRQMKRSGETGSSLYQSLVERDQQLETMAALETSYFVIRRADGTVRIGPRPTRNAILGLGLGLVVGLVLAFLREALDTRIRTAEDVAQRLHLPLLARIPAPSRRLRARAQLAMLREPLGRRAEPFRMLRTNLEFARFDRGLRTLLVTSAVEQEGKSTTAANLAVALARAGQRIVLVDLDLRRPYVERFFDLEGRPGVTDVALGRRGLEEALVHVPLDNGPPPISFRQRLQVRSGNGNGTRSSPARPEWQGRLDVLPCGALPPDPGEFVGGKPLRRLLEQIVERADLVVIDTPPLLSVGDAMALSAHVDALLLVCRANVVRAPMLAEVHRLLRSTPATALGFVFTGADDRDVYGYGYGYGYAYDEAPPSGRVFSGR